MRVCNSALVFIDLERVGKHSVGSSIPEDGAAAFNCQRQCLRALLKDVNQSNWSVSNSLHSTGRLAMGPER